MAHSNWDCSLVTSEDGGAKGRSMILGVLCDLVLFKPCLTSRQANIYPNFMHRMSPWPISRHKIWIPSLAILIAYILQSNIYFICIFLVSQLVVHDSARITIPDLKVFVLPWGHITFFDLTIVLHGETIPWCTSKIKVINGIVHLVFAHKRGILILGKSCCPDLKKIVDVGTRHLVSLEQKVSKLKHCSILESGKVIIGALLPRWRQCTFR